MGERALVPTSHLNRASSNWFLRMNLNEYVSSDPMGMLTYGRERSRGEGDWFLRMNLNEYVSSDPMGMLTYGRERSRGEGERERSEGVFVGLKGSDEGE